MPGKEEKYYYIPPGGKAVRLSEVRVDEKHGVIRAEGLPEPMGYFDEKKVRRPLMFIGRSAHPRLVRVSGLGRYIYNLDEGDVVHMAHDMDTTPDMNAAQTLSKLLDRCLSFDSKFVGTFYAELDIDESRLVILRSAFHDNSWQDIEYNILMLGPKEHSQLARILDKVKKLRQGSEGGAGYGLKYLDEETFDRLHRLARRCHEASREETEGILGKDELKHQLKRLKAFSRSARVDASRKLFEHYTQATDIIEPPREEPIKALIGALSDRDYRVKGNAAQTLGFLNAHSAVGRLQKMIRSDPNPEVRQDVSYAFGKIDDERSLTPLLNAINDVEPIVRRATAEALCRLSRFEVFRDAIPAIEEALIKRRDVEEDPEAREKITAAIEGIIKTK